MEWFALNHQVLAMETELNDLSVMNGLNSLQGLELRIALAWQLRQRDCHRALILAAEAEALLSDMPQLAEIDRDAHRARLQLLSAEISWLYGQLDATEQLAQSALTLFDKAGDRIGCGDARWALATVYLERGDVLLGNAFMNAAIEDFRSGGDADRQAAAQARGLAHTAFRDAPATELQLHDLFDEQRCATLGPAATACLASTQAIVAGLTGKPGAGSQYFVRAFNAATETGQVRLSIYAAGNAADALASLGDMDAALEWGERGLSGARQAAWPAPLGMALVQTGNIQRLLGRYADAHATLHEAMLALQDIPASQGHMLAQLYLGELALETGNPDAALLHFSKAEEKAELAGSAAYLYRAWSGQAMALCRIGQVDKALRKGQDALELARSQGGTDDQVKILRVFAELYQTYPLPAPEGMSEANPVLHYLKLALALAAGIEAYAVPIDLLSDLANAYAASGDEQQAQAYGQAAAQARANERLAQAHHRAESLLVRQDSERARAEAQSQRQLAEAQAQRAEALEEASATLEVLSQIGMELTGNLKSEAIFATFQRHLAQLMDVSAFFVFLLDAEGEVLNAAFSSAGTAEVPSQQIPLKHPRSHTARCARSRQQLIENERPAQEHPAHLNGPLATISMLFTPLAIGERLLGVMSVQSLLSNAYGEREAAICRTLCAYGAIALDNAAAYALAERAQRQTKQAMVALEEARNKLADRAEWLAGEVAKATQDVLARERETVVRLSKAAEYRDPETGAHILRMAHYSELIAQGLGLSDADRQLLLEAAPMHDIGKVGITDSILLKPGRLTPEEFEVMKQHAQIGHEILKDSSSLVLQTGAAIALGHHEKFDGSGYPQGLAGEAIPIFSRIVAVADVFDALTSERPYKKAWSLEQAADHLKAHRGSHFDPVCVDSFFERWEQVLEIRQRFKDDE
ncbi:HD domain-containing protein [Paucibacter sp. TC2R-5]|uniref:HD domain-containing phosphohydrolase n=1 Tax=Paucibacter sp. TC2R-5 TaxID=2893555 RepID=UPI0021E3DB17|nr:HD domain-containing phosphohydrolase [Paucibacter sp. TC2R-5]MCV2361076.1 HD domain-containing protein [Paucibacter sp. TC2R-5]